MSVSATRRGGAVDRLGRLARLAGPTIVSRAGILTMMIVDMVMLGRFNADELAYYGLGLSLFVPVMVTGVGLTTGVSILVSRRFGAGDIAGCREVFARALPLSVALGAAGALICLAAPLLFSAIGHAPELAAKATVVTQILAAGAFFQIGYVAAAFFVEGAQEPRPAMVVMLLANGLNILLNWLLIGGPLGLPAFGAAGAAASTALVRLFFLVALWGWIWRADFLGARAVLADFLGRMASFGRRGGGGRGFWGPGGWAEGAEMRRLGVAAGLGMFLETTAYGALTQLAGLLGASALAAWAIAYNIEATTFMIGLGVATATAVLVGAAIGAGDPREARRAAVTGVAATAVLLGVLAIGLALAGRSVAGLYTTDAAVAQTAGGILAISVLWITLDGVQLTLARTAQARGDIWPTAGRLAFAYWGVMTPAGAVAVLVLDAGVRGLAIAASLGVGTGAALLAWRLVFSGAPDAGLRTRLK